jgi:hypothetical protein
MKALIVVGSAAAVACGGSSNSVTASATVNGTVPGIALTSIAETTASVFEFPCRTLHPARIARSARSARIEVRLLTAGGRWSRALMLLGALSVQFSSHSGLAFYPFY